MPEIAPESLKDCHTRRVMHMDGADRDGRWFADVQQVVEYPRLQRTIKQWRKRTKLPETIWSVDGEEIGTLENALAALNALPLPPASVTELALLELIGDDWMATPVARISIMGLRDKALVEFDEERRCRRTDLGRMVLAAEQAGA